MNGLALSVRNASWTSKSGAKVLAQVNFDLAAGQVLGIAGANGAGKSTLLRLIYRYYRPATGAVLVNEVDIWRQSARDVARKIAIVLQEQPSEFSLSVREIVGLGRRPFGVGFARVAQDDAKIVDDALGQMGLDHLAQRLFGTLSGGERQRVMVARALAQQPQLLVLDEPTNHLDIRHQLEIVELIGSLPITVVTSLHDLNLVSRVCDSVLLLKNGKQVAFGAPEHVLTNEHIEAAYSVGVRREFLAQSKQNHLVFHL
ncbi:MAG: ABC transporter ATP-binding protein [Roseibium sp.]|nr:ABC transporter ATP-binding protein [Roseibium sp.]